MADIEIFQSQYTADQIEDEIENGVPYINSTNKHWMRWNVNTQAYEDTGIVAEGSGTGDMQKSVYDSTNAVANAGGIVPYVDSNGGKIDHIQVNGTEQTITNKTVNLTGLQETLVSGTNIKTVNGTTILGSGNIATPQGTITGITMNGASKGTSGVVDLGTVITSLSGYATTSAVNTKMNRTDNVTDANTSYTTLMARGESLNSSDTTPAVNGAICWTYS